MTTILRNIRLAFSTLINGDSAINNTTAQLAAQLNKPHHSRVVESRAKQYVETNEPVEVLKGYISTNDVSDFDSECTRNAIASLGAWSALAKGYNEFVKDQRSVKVGHFLNEFHAWNAVSPQQMDEDAVLMTVARLTEVKPAKANEATDAILARVRKCSVADVTAKRLADAAKKTAAREELLEAFIATVWAHVFSDQLFQISAAKVEAKIIQTLEWVAGWDSSNPAGQAAELLLIESDLHMCRRIAKEDRSNTEEFADGVLTADHMMQLSERKQA